MKNILFTAILAALAGSVPAYVKVPSIFSDNMVLQQNSEVAVWGWADVGEEVKVKGSWMERAVSTHADKDGKWQVKINTPGAGGPHSMSVQGNDLMISYANVLSGEVWICSGQSNMKMAVAECNNAQQEVAAAQYPQIRLFTVASDVSSVPQQDCKGFWQQCSPNIVWTFSAAGYYFGRELHQKLNVPIGIISANWGGTPAEAWTSQVALEPFKQYEPIIKAFQDAEKSKDPNAIAGKFSCCTPTALYNAMIAPLIPFRIAGAIWYQGESNIPRSAEYAKLFPAMITDWRKNWGIGDFPFYYVQIAPYSYGNNDASFSAYLREAQLKTLSAVKNTGMAVALDIGEEKDIHPKNKQEVGRRLALLALEKTYNKKIDSFSGPLYKTMKIENNRIRLSFDTYGELSAREGHLSDFIIAGEDKAFVPASAEIDGDTVIVWSDQIQNPVAVRYAWKNWTTGSLFNKAGLPASSFRTDNWNDNPDQPVSIDNYRN